MPESKQHRKVSKRIANKYNATYNRGKGADIKTNTVAIEVEMENTVDQGLEQLQGHQKRVYIAGTNKKAVEKAKEKTKGTTVGVTDKNGNIVKSSSRKTK